MMLNMKNESAKIIDALGGALALSKKLPIPRATIQAWKARGIPPKIQLAYPRLIARGRKLAKIKNDTEMLLP